MNPSSPPRRQACRVRCHGPRAVLAAMQTRWPKNPAREAWERFCYATTTKEHFAAVKALDDALGVKCGQSPLVFGTDDEDDAS